jgi:hypothetical protein
VFTTRNLWDIAPGILMSREAGAIIMGLDGKPYDYSKEGIMLAANEEIAGLMAEAFAPQVSLQAGMQKAFKALMIIIFMIKILDQYFNQQSYLCNSLS